MNTKGKKHTKHTAALDPGLVAVYRNYPAVDQDNSAQALRSFLVHRDLFRALGATEMAAAAERAWWADAVILAAEPADTADGARVKVEALQPALDGRPWHTVDDGLRAMAAMIAVAVALEQQRFGLQTPTRH